MKKSIQADVQRAPTEPQTVSEVQELSVCLTHAVMRSERLCRDRRSQLELLILSGSFSLCVIRQREETKQGVILFTALSTARAKRKQEIRHRGAKRGGRPRAASSHRSALCAAARPYANVTYANDAVKGRHSIARWRSAGELASLHLSSSNGPSTGDQGRGAVDKGGITGPYESELLF